jgi:hypothetical protein
MSKIALSKAFFSSPGRFGDRLAQTVLPFKLDTTADTLTAQAGLVLFGEYLPAVGLPSHLDRELPGPLNGMGYRPSSYGVSRVLMLPGGGRSLEDLRMLRADEGLRRTGAGEGWQGLSRVQRRVLPKLLKKAARNEYTLDIDATHIVAEKETAKWAYQGEKGYLPRVGGPWRKMA